MATLTPPREVVIYEQAARALKLQYPGVLFKFNHEDARKRGLRLQYLIRLLSSGRSWPDLHIEEPRGEYSGPYIEIKREGTRLKKKNGEWASPHLKEQNAMLEELRKRGKRAEFAIGFEAVWTIIVEYLGGRNVDTDAGAF